MISDMAEAVRMGNAAVESKENAESYMDWQRSLYRNMAKLRGEKLPTVWDQIKGSGKF